MRMLDKTFKNVDYKQIDNKKTAEWMFGSFDNKGWRSYFAYEDMRILKEMSFAKGERDYLILVGRRLQLLYLFDEMRKAFEMKMSEKQNQK